MSGSGCSDAHRMLSSGLHRMAESTPATIDAGTHDKSISPAQTIQVPHGGISSTSMNPSHSGGERAAVEQAAPRQERQDAVAGRERRCRCRLGPKPLLPAGEDSGHLRSYQVDVSALMDDVPRRAEFR